MGLARLVRVVAVPCSTKYGRVDHSGCLSGIAMSDAGGPRVKRSGIIRLVRPSSVKTGLTPLLEWAIE